MMSHAFLLGGTGQIGRATAAHLLDAGWAVTIAHRGLRPPPLTLLERGAIEVTLDRDEPGALARALGSGVDALVDAVAYDETHARQLLTFRAPWDRSSSFRHPASIATAAAGRSTRLRKRAFRSSPIRSGRLSLRSSLGLRPTRRARRRSSARCSMKPSRR